MIELGTEDQFRTVREALQRAAFTVPAVCERLGISSYDQIEDLGEREPLEAFDTDACRLLIRLFIEGLYTPAEEIARWLGDDVLQAMTALGLLGQHPAEPHSVAATASLYPIEHLWIASDRWSRPDGGVFDPPADVVYPALVSNAQRFQALLPRTGCDRFLELCSGTGVAALLAASGFAGRSWALDITERATRFGEWNRRLNGVANTEVLHGDLYEPVRGQQFDRIVAHPPYLPVLRPSYVYQDAGSDGEEIMRRTIAGLPEYLRPGGLFYMLAMSSDRADGALEARGRSWLGEAQNDFDVAVFPARFLEPDDFAIRVSLSSASAKTDSRALSRLFRDLGIVRMVYGALLIQRRAAPRAAFSIRRKIGPDTGWSDLLRLLEWETVMAQPGAIPGLQSLRVRANAAARLSVIHSFGEDGWEIANHVLTVERPFSMEAQTDAFIPYMMNFCDGSKTVAEHFSDLKKSEVIPDTTVIDDFCQAVAIMISGGFLLPVQEPDSLPHPARPS